METQNYFLRELTDAQLNLLRLEPWTFKRREYLYRVDDEVSHLYFMNKGLVTLIRPLDDGSRVAVWSFDGTLIGSQIRFWLPETVYDSYIRIGGAGWRVSRSRFMSAILRDPGFQYRVLRWIHYFDTSIAETAACIAAHSVEQRFCRNLLKVEHAMKGDPRLPLSLSQFAEMTATAKSHIYRIADVLAAEGALSFHGRETIIADRAIIEAHSCTCFAAVNRRRERALQIVPAETA